MSPTRIYTSNESGSRAVYLRSVRGRGQTLVAPGAAARWSPNGRQTFYADGNRLMVVDVELGDRPRVGEPSVVLDDPDYWLMAGPNPQYDVTPDGKSFLVLTEPVESDAPTIRVVVNWTEEVEALIAGGR
jgi:Tol biopolymer transport system component